MKAPAQLQWAGAFSMTKNIAALLLLAGLASCRSIPHGDWEQGWSKPVLPAAPQTLPIPARPVQEPAARIAPGAGVFRFEIRLPRGERLYGPLRCRVSEKSGAIGFKPEDRRFSMARARSPFYMPFLAEPGHSEVRLVVEFYSCKRGGQGPCFLRTDYHELSLDAEKGLRKSAVPVTLRID